VLEAVRDIEAARALGPGPSERCRSTRRLHLRQRALGARRPGAWRRLALTVSRRWSICAGPVARAALPEAPADLIDAGLPVRYARLRSICSAVAPDPSIGWSRLRDVKLPRQCAELLLRLGVLVLEVDDGAPPG
jgi:hypothetical protein